MISILGISAFYHDSAAALIVDGKIIAAAQEERFSRKKHDARYPFHAVEYVLKESKLKAQLTLQVHDELIVDTPKKETDKVAELLTKSMQEAADLDVPLVVDIGIGNNWDQAH